MDPDWQPSGSETESSVDDDLEAELFRGLPKNVVSRKLPVLIRKSCNGEPVPGPSTTSLNEVDDPDPFYQPPPLDSSIQTDGTENTEVDDNALEQPQELERGRKRRKNKENWKRNLNKRLKNEGKMYISAKGNTVQGKTYENKECNCSRRCSEQFTSPEVLKTFFETFWKLGDYSKQNAILRGSAKKTSVERSRPRDGSAPAKSVIFHYFIPDGKEDKRVCKSFFLSILQISWGRLYRCLSKEEAFGVQDGRGLLPASNKIDDSDVIEHIKSFPYQESHHSRKDNVNQRYLNPELNIRKMYDLYVLKCTEQNKQPVKEKYYYNVFSTKFNLHFKPPAKDTCKDCDALQVRIEAEGNEDEKKNLTVMKEEHLKLAASAREMLQIDKGRASRAMYVCTFDLQKALPFPKLTTSVAYYKRNMYVYNFGVHSFNDGTAHMYVYDETEGGRGAEDISSCLAKHLMEYASEFKHVVLFSDSCGGQNRNIKLSLVLLQLVQDPDISIETIELKYMVPGHSYLPNDADFGIIERASKKNHQIYTAEQWYETIKTAKRKRPQFHVHKMKREEFMSTATLEDVIRNNKKAVDGEPVKWLKIRWMKFEKGRSFIIQFKDSFDETTPFRELDLKQKKESKRENAKVLKGLNLQTLRGVKKTALYPHRRPITIAKKNDMKSLLPYIPAIHHSYFKNLPVEVTTRARTSLGEAEVQSDPEED